ncbi:MAG TPA: ABC transporter permease [Pseudolysinimonas sp.]|jgi:ABC-2 type transport system permease protein
MTAVAATAVAPVSLPTTLGTFVRRSILHTIRTPDALIMATVFPIIMMLLFTYVFGGAFDHSGGYVQYVVPGIILLCAGFGAAGVAVDVAQDMTTGIIDRFRTMPIHASAVIAGHVVTSLIRNLFATGVVIGVAVLVGFRPDATPLEWVAAFGLIALYILAITALFAAIGLASSSPEAASGYGFIVMFVPYVSSAFVPVSTMPVWLQGFAQHQPLTPIIETIRGLLRGSAIGDQGWIAVLWCLGILLVSTVITAVVFRAKAGHR